MLKKVFLIGLLIIMVSIAMAQDTTFQPKKNNFAIIPGANVTYPLSSSSIAGYVPYNASIAPNLDFDYYHIIHSDRLNTISYKIGCGGGIFLYTINDGNIQGGIESVGTMEKNIINLNTGISTAHKIGKVWWYNEISLSADYQNYDAIISGNFSPETISIVGGENSTQGGIYLLYSSGFTFSLGKNYNFTPLLEFPLVCLSNIWSWDYHPIPPSTIPQLPFGDFNIELMFSHAF